MTEGVESFKVVLVGESGVGKTSIITQFIDQTFQEDQQSTTGGTFSTKSVICDNGKTLKFEIWDTAGQERYRSLTKMFYKDANAAVLVYDITRKDSFEELQNYWSQQIKESSPPNIILAIAANKSDLISQEAVEEEKAREFANELGAIFVSTTATTVESINELFIEIAKKYTNATDIKIKGDDDGQEQAEEKNDNVKLSKDKANEKKEKKKGGFC
jgi:Ras-related protein Rab-5C